MMSPGQLFLYDLKNMKWSDFYFSSKGRVPAYQFNLYMLIPVVLITKISGPIGENLMTSFDNMQQAMVTSSLFSLVIALITTWPFVSVTNKRFHDHDMSGKQQILYGVVLCVTLGVMITGLNINPMNLPLIQKSWGMFLSTVSIGSGVSFYIGAIASILLIMHLFIKLCVLKGDPDQNNYGPNPMDERYRAHLSHEG